MSWKHSDNMYMQGISMQLKTWIKSKWDSKERYCYFCPSLEAN